MRRADRLFRIVQLLRAGRLVTARVLAEKLEVSARTVYRDIVDLQLSGMPIEGEAGVGYTLRRDFDIPPLMFDREEIAALVLGARMVRSWSSPQLAEAANRALRKIEAVLPRNLRDEVDAVALFAPGFHFPSEVRQPLDLLRTAAAKKQVVRFGYRRGDGEASERRARPLALAYWGKSWTLIAWCELREDFRSFRVDRMDSVAALEETFTLNAAQTLEEFLRRVQNREPHTKR